MACIWMKRSKFYEMDLLFLMKSFLKQVLRKHESLVITAPGFSRLDIYCLLLSGTFIYEKQFVSLNENSLGKKYEGKHSIIYT